MDFINPIEVLSLGTGSEGSVDLALLRKAKRKIQAEIDLSDDGYLTYHGRKLTLTDCEPAFSEVENSESYLFYKSLLASPKLNSFLAAGGTSIFSELKRESIYTDSNFIKFISPYFSERYNQALLNAFESNKPEELAKIVHFKPLVSASYLDACFKGVYLLMQSHTREVGDAAAKIKAGDYATDNSRVVALLKNTVGSFSAGLLNQLPDYFQNTLNNHAQALRNFGVQHYNKSDETSTAIQLLDLATSIRAEPLVLDDIKKVFKQISDIRDSRLAREKFKPVVERVDALRKSLNDINTKLKAKAGSSADLLAKLDSMYSIQEVNAIPDSLIDVRDLFALTLRNLSISAWNNDNDILWSSSLIERALSVNVSRETKDTLLKEKNEIAVLEAKYKSVLACWFCETSMLDEKATYSRNVYKVTGRSYRGRTRKVSYSIKQLSFARCKQCKRTHLKGTVRYWLTFLGGGLLVLALGIGLAIAFTSTQADTESGFWFVLILALIAAHFIGRYMEGRLLASVGVRSKYTKSLSQHPMMEALRKDDWSWSKPAA
jgi:hypothetical protein